MPSELAVPDPGVYTVCMDQVKRGADGSETWTADERARLAASIRDVGYAIAPGIVPPTLVAELKNGLAEAMRG